MKRSEKIQMLIDKFDAIISYDADWKNSLNQFFIDQCLYEGPMTTEGIEFDRNVLHAMESDDAHSELTSLKEKYRGE